MDAGIGQPSENSAARARRRRSRVASRLSEPGSLTPVTLLLAGAVIGSMLAIGSVHVPALLVVCPLGIAAAVATFTRRSARVLPLPPPAIVIALLAAYTVFQALPLPLAVIQSLTPTSAKIWESATELLGRQAGWMSISLDPGASLVEALKWASYAGVFIAGAVLAHESGLLRVAGIVFGSAVIATVVTLVHRLLHAETLYGLYRPVFASPSFAMAPLLNSNNLAGYLNLGAFAGLGLFVSSEPPVPRWVIGIGVAAVMGLSAVCGSRAGFSSLSIGAVWLTIALWRKRFDGRVGSRSLLLLQVAVIVSAGVLFVLGASADVWSALFEEGTKKIELFSWTRPLISRHFLSGIGRGSFETAFPAYRVDIGNHVYQFAENFVLQWCAEWGVPVALAALVAFGITLRPSRLGVSRSPLALSCSIGVAVLLLQNMLDLALEVGSVSIALAALLGGLWGAEHAKASDSQRERIQNPRRSAALLLAAVGACVLLAAAMAGWDTPVRDRAALAAAFHLSQRGDTRAKRELPGLIDAAISRHPADPYLAAIGAMSHPPNDRAILRWIARAIDRDPMSGRVYLLLARVFAAHGKVDQALLAVRMAAERDDASVPPGVQLALSMVKDYSQLSEAEPQGKAGAMFLSVLAVQPRLSAHRTELLEQALKQDPEFERPPLLLGEDFVSALEANRDPCRGDAARGCTLRVAELAKLLGKIDRASSVPVTFTARLLLVQGLNREAEHLLAERCTMYRNPIPCLTWRVRAAARLDTPLLLQDAAAAYLAAACTDATECAAGATWLAGIYLDLRDPADAVRMYERAARETGSSEAWQHVANLSKQLGLNTAADRALLRSGGAPDPTVTQELDRARLNLAVHGHLP